MSADRATRHYQYGGSPANWAGSIVALIGFIVATVGAMAGPSWTTCIGCRLSCAGWSRHPGDARYGLRRGSLNAAHCYRNGP